MGKAKPLFCGALRQKEGFKTHVIPAQAEFPVHLQTTLATLSVLE